MGVAISRYSELTSNELLMRFCSTEPICANDPFWNQMLAFNITPPSNPEEQLMLDSSAEPLLQKFLQNNPETGNLGSLVQVFITRATELLASPNSDNVMLAWQTYNALFVIRAVVKYLVEMVAEYELCRHLDVQGERRGARGQPQEQDASEADQSSQPSTPEAKPAETKPSPKIVNGESKVEMLIDALFGLIIDVPVTDNTYYLHLECINSLLVLMSVYMFAGVHGQTSFMETSLIYSSSIFGHGIHKFGKIVIQKKENKLRQISLYLLKSGYAELNFKEFEDKLQTETLYPALTNQVKDDIVNCLTIAVNYKFILRWRKQVMKLQQLKHSVKTIKKSPKTVKGAKSDLTEKDVNEILEKKLKDLALCNADAGESSLGRACRKMKANTSNAVSKRKADVLSQQDEKVTDGNAKKMAADTDMDADADKDTDSEMADSFELEPQKVKGAKKAKTEVNRLAEARAPGEKRKIIIGPPGINPSKLRPVEVEDMEDRSGDEMKGAKVPSKKVVNIPINKNVKVKYIVPDILVDSPRVVIEASQLKTGENFEMSATTTTNMTKSKLLQRQLNIYREAQRLSASAFTLGSDSTVRDSSSIVDDSSDKDLVAMISKLDLEVSEFSPVETKKTFVAPTAPVLKNHVNPFQNVDAFMSVFVDKLAGPVLMVHSQLQKRIEASTGLSEIHFNQHIHNTLRNMLVQRPMMVQYISWQVILRGWSLFMICPPHSGKTMGYLPAVCRHVSDCRGLESESSGPFCIIVCATANAVTEVTVLARRFLGVQEKVLSLYSGMDDLTITSGLLNGCDLLISTPPMLVRIINSSSFYLDLNKLAMFVLDDCERLNEVYLKETMVITRKVKEVEKTRVDQVLKVQYVVASRVWCEFMRPLAKKAPSAVMCFSAFQECVLYSKADTTVNFVKKDNKINVVLDFMNDIDISKKTVIVCSSDEEVDALEKSLKSKYPVFACNNSMTVSDLYNLSRDWDEFEEPVLGPILVCCDGNLTHMNITDAHHLIHFSMPPLFSMFCKRFAVLNANYASIFKETGENVKIKVLIEESNVDQIPKLLNFVKRCTKQVPPALDVICQKILYEKDARKAQALVPLCDTLLSIGECADFWNCSERHSILKDFDEPKDWMPTRGVVTFNILYYHSAAMYSARLFTNVVNGVTTKYPPNYSTLSLKLGVYFSKECNKKLHGIPKVGDICAVSLKQNFFTRCQVLKVLSRYQRNDNPNEVLIRLIDEEKTETTRDIYLHYLPEELKIIQSHVVQVRLSNVQPKDKDIGFSKLARNQLKLITDKDEEIFMRGKINFTVGNCIFVETLEACQHLTYLKAEVVKHDFKKELLERHGVENKNHIERIRDLCRIGGLDIHTPIAEEPNEIKASQKLPEVRWAHLEEGDFSVVLFGSAVNPEKLFVRLAKFESCMKLLLKDIKNYIDEGEYERIEKVDRGDIVLAKFPGDDTYERARVESIVSEEKVSCFFVDQGDWRDVALRDLAKITPNFIMTIPFQAIECRLVGVKPVGESWTEFGTNWLCQNCYNSKGFIKDLYVKYFTKEIAECTGGHKYGIVIVDTTTETDVIMNQLMIDLNLAQVEEGEIHYLNDLGFERESVDYSDEDDDNDDHDDDWEQPKQVVSYSRETNNNNTEATIPFENIFLKQPLRSVPLVGSDDEGSDDSDKWNLHMGEEFIKMFNPMFAQKATNENVAESLPAIVESKQNDNMIKPSSSSDFEVIQLPNLKDLDSDDLSSPDVTMVSKSEAMTVIAETRKPKVTWRQDKTTVTFKIQIMGVDEYSLEIRNRQLKFSAVANNTDYAFEFQLYGVINEEKTIHCNKGQYIWVKMTKLMKKIWLNLARDGAIKKWIVYDVDSINVSSDEEEAVDNSFTNIVKTMHYAETDTEDEDFCDDVNYNYKGHGN